MSVKQVISDANNKSLPGSKKCTEQFDLLKA